MSIDNVSLFNAKLCVYRFALVELGSDVSVRLVTEKLPLR